jgi:DnaJ homolog subfamily B member 12
MESNRDEAEKCLRIARKHFDSGNISSARKFCQKSISLFETPAALKLLASINDAKEGPATASTSSATEGHPSAAGVKHRHTAPSSSGSTANGSAGGSEKKRDYTPEQHAVVKRVNACKVTAYYEILALEKDCEENDVKKAYRKVSNYIPRNLICYRPHLQLALALHPDKNGAPGADEAFKCEY